MISGGRQLQFACIGINKPIRRQKGGPDERAEAAGVTLDQRVHFIRNGRPPQDDQDEPPENACRVMPLPRRKRIGYRRRGPIRRHG